MITWENTTVLMLTASQLEDKVTGLEGADVI